MTIDRTKMATDDISQNRQVSGKADHMKDTRFKKGVSGNPGGRPKQPLKEFARKFLEEMTEEDKKVWMKGIPALDVWKMAEGNPASKSTIDGELKLPVPLIALGKD